jgi:hypothetical protein
VTLSPCLCKQRRKLQVDHDKSKGKDGDGGGRPVAIEHEEIRKIEGESNKRADCKVRNGAQGCAHGGVAACCLQANIQTRITRREAESARGRWEAPTAAMGTRSPGTNRVPVVGFSTQNDANPMERKTRMAYSSRARKDGNIQCPATLNFAIPRLYAEG